MGRRPACLARLGLTRAADEQAIRRAYARELKRIDQARDPGAFQELREAYEAARTWHRARQVGLLPVTPPPARMRPARPAAPVPPTPDLAPAPPTPALDEASPYGGAEVFTELATRIATLAADGPPDPPALTQAFSLALEDPRLVPLSARFQFEQCLANHLASGRRPGHTQVLEQAILRFGWHRDHRRLARLGWAGEQLGEAVDSVATLPPLPVVPEPEPEPAWIGKPEAKPWNGWSLLCALYFFLMMIRLLVKD